MPVTEYVWDPGTDAYLMEKDGAGHTTAVYHNEPVPYGNLISQRRDGQTYYHHYDALGCTRQLTDESQDVTDEYTYSAYGETVSPPTATENPFRWIGSVGYYFDEATGGYYVRARNYSPIQGRWTSIDPLLFADGLNLYAAYFVPNGSDPSGRGFFDWWNRCFGRTPPPTTPGPYKECLDKCDGVCAGAGAACAAACIKICDHFGGRVPCDGLVKYVNSLVKKSSPTGKKFAYESGLGLCERYGCGGKCLEILKP